MIRALFGEVRDLARAIGRCADHKLGGLAVDCIVAPRTYPLIMLERAIPMASWRSMIDPKAIVCHAVGASNENTIEKGKSRVGRKRIVHGFSNQMAVSSKTFIGPRLFPALAWLDRAARDLLKLRWKYFFLDCSAAWLTLRRLPDLRRDRSANRELNDKFPGQNWFTHPRFDWHHFNGATTTAHHSAEQTKTN